MLATAATVFALFAFVPALAAVELTLTNPLPFARAAEPMTCGVPL